MTLDWSSGKLFGGGKKKRSEEQNLPVPAQVGEGVGILDMVVPLLVNKIHKSIAELDNWVETHPPSPDERLWYESLRKKLLFAQESRTIDDVEYITKIITRMIADSGPLDKDFLPSYQDLVNKLEKLRK